MKSPHETGAIRDLFGGASGRHNTKPQSPKQAQYSVVCSEFRVFAKNTLQGFATLCVTPPGLVTQGCGAHAKDGKRWVNFPAKQYTGEDGTTRWQPLITVEGKPEYWRFQDLALAAIDGYLGESGIEARG